MKPYYLCNTLRARLARLMDSMKKTTRRIVRALFRLCGGYHKTEHAEILHVKLCAAERETAQLRLYKHNTEFRLKSLRNMLREELNAR